MDSDYIKTFYKTIPHKTLVILTLQINDNETNLK